MQRSFSIVGRQAPISQWITVSASGVVFGLAVLGAFALPQEWTALTLLALLFVCLIVIVGNPQRMLLAVVLLEIPSRVDVSLFFNEEYALMGMQSGLILSAASLLLVGLYILWAVESLMRKRQTLPSPASIVVPSFPSIAYFITSCLCVLPAYNVQFALFEAITVLQMVLLHIYILHAVRTQKDVFFVLACLSISLGFEGFVMIGVRLFGEGVSLGPFTARLGETLRVGGTIGSSNNAAAFLVFLIPLAISTLLTTMSRAYKVLALFAAGLGGIALMLTSSRGGWLGGGTALLVIFIGAWRSGRLSTARLLWLVMIGASFALVFYDTILVRLTSDDGGAAYSRWPLIQMAFEMFLDHPFFGVGSNNFALALPSYATSAYSGEWLYTVHNKYLLVLTENGIVGLLAFMWVLLAALGSAYRTWHTPHPIISPLALGVVAALAGQMVCMSVGIFNGRQDIFWTITALGIALERLEHCD